MANRMTTYNSRASVKARKVTDKDGETVVTSAGPVRAEKGDYVVDHGDGGIGVTQGEDFERLWKAASTRKTSKASQTRKKASAKRAPAKTAESSSARVRASQRGSSK